MKRSWVHVSICALAIITNSRCASQAIKSVNSHFPRVQPIDRQLQATRDSAAGLARLRDASFFVRIEPNTMENRLRQTLATQVPDVQLRRVATAKQAVYLEADFDHEFPEVPARIAGRVGFYTAPAFQGSELVLRPALSELRIKKMKYRGSGSITPLLPAINAALMAFLDRINGQIQEQHIPLQMPLVKTVVPQEVFAKTQGVKNVTGNPVKFDIKLEHAVVIVDPGGIKVLGSLTPPVDLPTGPAAVNAAECMTPFPEFSPPPCESNCPVANLACHVEKIRCEYRKAVEKSRYERGKIAHSRRCAQQGAAAAVPTGDGAAFEHEFADLSRAFEELTRQTMGISSASYGKNVIAVNRRYLAQVINTAFREPNVCGKYESPFFSNRFSDDVYTPPPADLKCGENPRSCSINQPCDRAPYPGRGCPGSCDLWDLGCHGRKLDCERLKAMEQVQWEAQESGKKLVCEADKELKRLDCERLKAMEIAGCELNQRWLNAVGHTKLGKYDVTVEARGSLDACFQRLYVGDALEGTELTLSFTGRGEVGGPVSFTPANIGHVACQAVVNGHIQAEILIREDRGTFAGRTTWDSLEDGGVRLELTTKPRKIDFVVSPSPYDALMQQTNIRTACAPVGLYAAATARIGESLLPQELHNGRFSVDLPTITLPVRIEPVELTIGGQRLRVTPRITSNALIFAVE